MVCWRTWNPLSTEIVFYYCVTFQTSTNVSRVRWSPERTILITTATRTPTVPTPRARSTARATRATLGTESRVSVGYDVLSFRIILAAVARVSIEDFKPCLSRPSRLLWTVPIKVPSGEHPLVPEKWTHHRGWWSGMPQSKRGPCLVAGHVPTLPWVRSRVWVRVGLGSGLASGRGWVGTWPVNRLDPKTTWTLTNSHVFSYSTRSDDTWLSWKQQIRSRWKCMGEGGSARGVW